MNLTGTVRGERLLGTRKNDLVLGLAGDDIVFGRAGNDLLRGDADRDTLHGEAGDDTLEGAAGNDALNGGSGRDVLDGGTGADSLSGDGGNDRLFGRVGDDRLYGGGGDDTLDGGSGADLMEGGSGNDAYYVDDAGDRAVEAGGGGSDAVFASVDFTLGAHLEALKLYASAWSGTGNSGSNTITGNSASNRLRGLQGQDRLFGLGGDDILDGGSGADTMDGGAGDDAYYVDTFGDTLIEAMAGTAGGNDTVHASVDWRLGVNFEGLNLYSGALRGTGNALANHLRGSGGDNILRGLGGNDHLEGGPGRDLLDGGPGTDVAIYRFDYDYDTQSAIGVIADLDRGTIAFSDPRLQPETLLSIEGIASGDGVDLITGSDDDDMIRVGEGANIVQGGGGSDTIYGGRTSALDFSFFDENGNLPLEFLGGGDGDDIIFGNGNILEGQNYNFASDVLDGGRGDDMLHVDFAINLLTGGRGSDQFIFHDAVLWDQFGPGFGRGLSAQITDFDRSEGDKIVIDINYPRDGIDPEYPNQVPDYLGQAADLQPGQMGYTAFGGGYHIKWVISHEQDRDAYDVSLDIRLVEASQAPIASDFVFV